MMLLKKFHLLLVGLAIITLSLSLSSCIVIDDNDDDDQLEQVNYHNNTNYTVENFIDDVYRGSVEPYGSITVFGDFEGYHKYFSRAIGIDWEWGPDYLPEDHPLPDGGVLNIRLDPP